MFSCLGSTTRLTTAFPLDTTFGFATAFRFTALTATTPLATALTSSLVLAARRLTTTSWLTTASAIHRSAGGVTAWLAGGANQIIRAMVAGAKHASVRYLRDTHLGGLFAATTSGSASLDVRAADLLVVFHLRAAL